MAQLMEILVDILYAYLAIGTLYLAVFAVASTVNKGRVYPSTTPHLRFRILLPAYKEDRVIAESAAAALAQTYPRTLYDVCVIADGMQAETLDHLRDLGAHVIDLKLPESSKAKALAFAMQASGTEGRQIPIPYDYAIILDADNLVQPLFLQQVHDYLLATGERIMQAHRTAKNRNTPTAILDAAIEEMNNSIFRAGHVNLGISSSLIGSGMIMEYAWFASHIALASTAGEDKEIEEMLLRERIHIGYAPHIYVYDEKVQRSAALRQQRRRWLASQIVLALTMRRHLGKALRECNANYLLKFLETLIPPRSILLALLSGLSLVFTLLSPATCWRWWILWGILLASMYMAIPSSLRNRRLWAALRRTPLFIGIMIGNLFKLRGASSKFIHTSHGT